MCMFVTGYEQQMLWTLMYKPDSFSNPKQTVGRTEGVGWHSLYGKPMGLNLNNSLGSVFKPMCLFICEPDYIFQHQGLVPFFLSTMVP